MKNTILLWAFFSAVGLASDSEDYMSLQYDYFNFTGSKQKDYGNRGTIHVKGIHEDKTFQIAYEKTITETYKPPMTNNLNVDKVMVRYDHKVFDLGQYDLGLITVRDNIVPTDGGIVVYAGYQYRIRSQFTLEGRFYYGYYPIMRTYQFDASLKWHQTFGALDTRVIGIVKDIIVDDCQDGFCAKAEPNYLSAGLKIKLDYEEYFLHGAAFVGKRVFAVMMEGFMLQHHAMEFDRTYMVGIGKRFKDIELKLKYTFQRAEELPLNNSGIDIDAVSLRAKYFF